MGLDIIIPVILVVVLAPIAFVWAKRNFKGNAGVVDSEAFVAPSDRLTSNALRELDSPPWRVVYEVAHDKLNGIGHVLIGPPGVFALRTTMDPFPREIADASATEIAEAAIARGAVDDALSRCAMSADQLVIVHWGVNEGAEIAVDLMPGATAVDGRTINTWASSSNDDENLTQAQIDLAWQTVVTSIGRPDPLA